jgi:hypothetical protein
MIRAWPKLLIASLAALASAASVSCWAILGIEEKYLVATGGAGAGSDAGADSGDGAADADAGPCGAQDDQHNCGTCGHDCEHGLCEAGVCQPYALAFTQGGDRPQGLAVPGDGFVYFGDYDSHTVNQVEDGVWLQASPTVLAASTFRPSGLVVDANEVYFSVVDPTGKGDPLPAYRVSKTGGLPPTALSGSWSWAEALAADTTDLYLAAAYGLECAIARVPKNGAPGTTLVFINGGNCLSIDVDSSFVYVTDQRQGTVLRIDKSASGADAGSVNVLPIDVDSQSPFPVVVDASFVYWGDLHGIYRKAKDGSGPRVTLATFNASPPDAGGVSGDQPASLSLAVDRIFYAIPGYGGTGIVASVSTIDPTEMPEIVATEQDAVSNVVATSNAVYWIAQFQHVIMKRVR